MTARSAFKLHSLRYLSLLLKKYSIEVVAPALLISDAASGPSLAKHPNTARISQITDWRRSVLNPSSKEAESLSVDEESNDSHFLVHLHDRGQFY